MKRSSSNRKWNRHMALAALPIRYFPSIIHVQVSPVTYGDTPSRQQDFSMTQLCAKCAKQFVYQNHWQN